MQVNVQARDVIDAWSIHQLSSGIQRIQGPCACQNIMNTANTFLFS